MPINSNHRIEFDEKVKEQHEELLKENGSDYYTAVAKFDLNCTHDFKYLFQKEFKVEGRSIYVIKLLNYFFTYKRKEGVKKILILTKIDEDI